MIKSEILVPLLNANEPEARLVHIYVKDGQAIEKGAPLFTLETTKAAADIESPETGFVHLLTTEGDTVTVGDSLAMITDSLDKPVGILPRGDAPAPHEEIPPLGMLRITKPARSLAKSLGVDLATLPIGQLVTEKDVRQTVSAKERIDFRFPASEKPYLVIFGGGGHAKAIMDMIKQLSNYAIAGILDDDELRKGKKILGIPVLGTRVLLPTLIKQGVNLAANGVGGIIDIGVRVKIFELLEGAGFKFPALIHPRSTVEPSATIGEGIQIFANAYVGSEAILHPRCMVNTNAVISHDCDIGSYTHIAPGALLAGHVQVGERTLVGMGVTTIIGVHIGSGVRIGNGAIVLADVPDKMVIQAGRYWAGKAEKSA
jgi:sugar O-acyltransferase (sialic acid O-acetyltransferase NeuD family)